MKNIYSSLFLMGALTIGGCCFNSGPPNWGVVKYASPVYSSDGTLIQELYCGNDEEGGDCAREMGKTCTTSGYNIIDSEGTTYMHNAESVRYYRIRFSCKKNN